LDSGAPADGDGVGEIRLGCGDGEGSLRRISLAVLVGEDNGLVNSRPCSVPGLPSCKGKTLLLGCSVGEGGSGGGTCIDVVGTVDVGRGVIVAVGVGPGVAVGVDRGVGVGLGVSVGDGVALGVDGGVGDGVTLDGGVGRGVGIGVGDGERNSVNGVSAGSASIGFVGSSFAPGVALTANVDPGSSQLLTLSPLTKVACNFVFPCIRMTGPSNFPRTIFPV
jgi:hypothetical protein